MAPRKRTESVCSNLNCYSHSFAMAVYPCCVNLHLLLQPPLHSFAVCFSRAVLQRCLGLPGPCELATGRPAANGPRPGSSSRHNCRGRQYTLSDCSSAPLMVKPSAPQQPYPLASMAFLCSSALLSTLGRSTPDAAPASMVSARSFGSL